MPEQPKELSPEKMQLLQRRLQGAAGKSRQESVIKPRKRTEADLSSNQVRLPVSYAEEGLWLVDQLEPNRAAYNIPFGMRLKGALNTAALQRSLNEVVHRHEILRTRFESEEGRPVQVIEPAVPLEIPLEDLAGFPENRRVDEAMRICNAEAGRPFDLRQDSLVRAKLLRLGAGDHLLFLNVHHIAFDGWSVNLLLRELTILYDSFANGKISPLTPLPIQYADYAIWQRDWMRGERLDEQLSYWKKQLEGAPALLELPSDRPRPATPSYEGAQITRDLPKVLMHELTEFTKQEGVTLFITLMAAFQTLLQRYTGQTDLPVGTPIAGRNWKEVEELVGFFVNTLVMRGDLSGDPAFRTLLERTRKMALEAYAHQDIPFEMLVKELHQKRNVSHSPLFQIMFVLVELPQITTQLGALEATTLLLRSGTSKFDLTVFVIKRGESFQMMAEYSTDLFDAGTVERMLGHYQRLLEGIISNPGEKISQLPLLTEGERRQILVEWNRTEVDYPKDRCLHELIEEQVERTPETAAVMFEENALTYRELNSRANQLARYLKGLGVGLDSLVGICVERSLEMVIGALAILKAGGAYVPLDPEYPKERLAFMLEDSGVGVLLTQAHLETTLPAGNAARIRLDADWPAIAEANSANVDNTASAENLAYMIYTSGSTGRPKGAMNTHAGIVNRLLWMQDAYPLTPVDKVLQKTPFSFDVSVWELFGPLIAGACLVVARPGGHRDPAYLAQMIARKKITTMHFVPPMLRALLEQEGLKESGSSLKRVFCGGELMPVKLQQQFFSTLEAELSNLYGPAEASVDATYWLCKQNSRLSCVPIGRPIANIKSYILDPHLQPVPVGVVGELHISGIGLGRGYHKRPELTAEKFIANPFSTDPKSRLYKTGDLARYLPGGEIEYIGRIDHQVKIRGFRIELGEIEEVLGRHPAVREAAVTVHEDTQGNKRLIAHIAGRNGIVSSSELQKYLRGELPDYMVPATFVTLDALPLSPNGKVDRKALSAGELKVQTHEFTPPNTATEFILAEIWCKVLGLKQVGINDNFFELGGDSILSFQVVSRASRAGLHLTPGQIFRYQTIGELAALAKRPPSSAVEQGAITGDIPLTPIQEWFFSRNFDEPQFWNQTMMLEISPDADVALLEKAIENLVAHHDALRLRFRRQGPGWIQFNAATEENVLLARWNFGALNNEAWNAAVQKATTQLNSQLNLENGPIIKFAWFGRGTGQAGRLLIVIHHLAVDGVSWRILLQDLQTAYDQLYRKEPVNLPLKTASFQVWAQKLREYAQSSLLKKESDYWLAAAPRQSDQIPTDFTGGENIEGSAFTVSVGLEAQETDMLLRSVPKAYKTQINDILIAALGLTLSRWLGKSVVHASLEGHGREEIFEDVDLSRTVGWFTTVFPLRLDLRHLNEPGALLKSVKEQLRNIPNHGIGYGLLRYLNEDNAFKAQWKALRDPEIAFNFLGQFDQTLPEKSLFSFGRESVGVARSPTAERGHLLAVTGWVIDGRLQFDWASSSNVYRKTTIERLAGAFLDNLRSLIRHCMSPEAGGYTPSDFAESGLNQEELDDLMLELNKPQGIK